MNKIILASILFGLFLITCGYATVYMEPWTTNQLGNQHNLTDMDYIEANTIDVTDLTASGTINFTDGVPWTDIKDSTFPGASPNGYAITQINHTLTTTRFLLGTGDTWEGNQNAGEYNATNLTYVEAETFDDGTANLTGGVLNDADLSGSIMANGEDWIGGWSFEKRDGTIAYDSSPEGNDGTVSGSPTVVTGRFGRALEFDGTNKYVSISDSTDLKQNTSGQTFSLWMNRINASSDSDVGLITIWNKISLSYENSHGICINSWNSSGTQHLYSTNVIVNNNEWNRITIAFNGTKWNIYKNGAFINTSDSINTGYSGLGTSDLFIGRFSWDYGKFNGTIDEVAIWNRTLTDEEIRMNYISNLASISQNGHKMDKTGGNFTGTTYHNQGTGDCYLDSSGAVILCRCVNSTDDVVDTTNESKCYE